MSDGYTVTSYTSSGWTISTNPNAAKAKRWRIVHPEFGERFFRERADILPWTCSNTAEMVFDKIFGKEKAK